jgi:hypothetical protein
MKRFSTALQYWTPKRGVESKVLNFWNDPDKTSAGISRQIQKRPLENLISINNSSSFCGDIAGVNI